MSEPNELSQLLAEMKSLREKLAEQDRETALLRTQVQELKQSQPTPTTSLAKATQTPTSRRKMLKAGVLAAGLAVAGAATTAITPHSAEAATGDAITVGGSFAPTNASDGPTRLYNPSTTDLSPALLQVDNTLNTPATLPFTPVAIAATSTGDTAIGVYGSGDIGLYGVSNTQTGKGVYGEGRFAVYGISTWSGGAGVYGENNSTGGPGVLGISDGIGVHGTATNIFSTDTPGVLGNGHYCGVMGVGTDTSGIDGLGGFGGIFQGTRANLWLESAGLAPLKRTTPHTTGEIIVDSNSDVWVCVTAGTPGVWRQLAGANTAGSFHTLAPALRVVDTRTGHTNVAPSTYSSRGGTPTNAFMAGEIRTYDFSVSGTTIPAGATALSAVISATNPTMPSGATGYFTLWAGSVTSVPAVAQVTYSVPSVTNSGFFITPLTSTRQFNIYTLRATDVIIDLVGYYL